MRQPCLAWLSPTKSFDSDGRRLLFARGSRAHAITQPEAHTIKTWRSSPVEFSTPSMRAAPAGSCISTTLCFYASIAAQMRPSDPTGRTWRCSSRKTTMHVPATARPTAAGELGKKNKVPSNPVEGLGRLSLPHQEGPLLRVPVIARKALASEEGFGSLLSKGRASHARASSRGLRYRVWKSQQ